MLHSLAQVALDASAVTIAETSPPLFSTVALLITKIIYTF